MAPVQEVKVVLTDEMVRAVQEAVDAGDYVNAGEVVRDALRLWRERRACGRRPGTSPGLGRGGETG